MKLLHCSAALVLLLACGNLAFAQGAITWTTGYPKADTMAGRFLVEGTIKPPTGWKIKDKTPGLARFGEATGENTLSKNDNVPVSVALQTFGGSLSGTPNLKKNTVYYITVEVVIYEVANPANEKTIVTVPAMKTSPNLP